MQVDYPWEELPNGATVVDVGGGVGMNFEIT